MGWLEGHVRVLVQYCAWDPAGVGLALADAVGDGSGQCTGSGLQVGVLG